MGEGAGKAVARLFDSRRPIPQHRDEAKHVRKDFEGFSGLFPRGPRIDATKDWLPPQRPSAVPARFKPVEFANVEIKEKIPPSWDRVGMGEATVRKETRRNCCLIGK